MQKLRAPVPAGSRGSPRGSVTVAVQTTNFRSDQLPRVLDRDADVDLTKAWTAWIPERGERTLRRELTAGERGVLSRRADELSVALHPYVEADLDAVSLAVADMFGGFTSMRQGGEDAVAKIDSVGRLLRPFPAWAIVKVCASIQSNGVWRDGKFDRRWPPNDSEIVAAIREELRHYQRSHESAVALLAAKVEEQPDA